MLFTVITPNYNGGRFLEEAIQSVLRQKAQDGIELEYIIVDGMSTDCSADIIEKYSDELSYVIREKDTGPANAINKGLKIASGDVVSWLNADDRYLPGAYGRVRKTLRQHPDAALCFGRCPIIDESGNEIRRLITLFKQAFFPLSSRPLLQCLNYISQPATFFRKEAVRLAGRLREDLEAAWDYDFTLRLWRQGRAARIQGPPIANFRWHQTSISAKSYMTQFREEFEIAGRDAGHLAPQTLIHAAVRWGIVGCYGLMAAARRHRQHEVRH